MESRDSSAKVASAKEISHREEEGGRDRPRAEPITAGEFARTGKVTPMLRQYFDMKAAYADCVLLFRLGDFYECFFEDAVSASKVLDITLTGRGKGDDRFPMAGIPHHAAKAYIGRLVEAGHKVALCDQTEDASASKGLVRREVVQIVTPGMVVDDDLLDPRAERLVAAVSLEASGPAVGLALLELSTGAFRATTLPDSESAAMELTRSAPKELIFSDEADAEVIAELTRCTPRVALSHREPRAFDHREALGRLTRHFGVSTLAGFGVPGGAGGRLLTSAAGAALRYAAESHKEAAVHIDRLQVYDPGAELVVDAATSNNLEILQTLHGGRKSGSLLGLLDRSSTAMGGRLVRKWLGRPLGDLASIRRRSDAVERLVGSPSLCEELRAVLRGVVDMERTLGRLALGHGSPRDMKGIERSLAVVVDLQETLGRLPAHPVEPPEGGGAPSGAEGASPASAADEGPDKGNPEAAPRTGRGLIDELRDGLDPLPDLVSFLEGALVEEAPASIREGGFVRAGFDPDLDELVDLATHGKDHLLRLEASERERTGISSLKVRYNRVFGYYIEVTKTNLRLVPPEYVRKQTTSNAERFTTPQLQSWEEKIVTAEQRRRALELRIFEDLRAAILERAGRVRAVADRMAEIDAVLSLARVALALDWRRPTLDDSRDLLIEDGRHPVVESAMREEGGEPYVPSDVVLEGDRPLMIVTGPNMAGKSTVMRMAALVVLLAHAGSFVPARRARVGLCDRIFTRVGASDDLAGGRSTFMVEMTETAAILNQATDRSLVILDEIGRGTSTFDGLSIAWAVAEDLHDRVRCRTMFATHYHELTDLSKERPGVSNYTVAVREWDQKVIFLRRLIEGAANRSYGIQVARLAGLPGRVLDRAAEVLGNLESAELDEVGRPTLAKSRTPRAESPGQLSLFSRRPPPTHEELLALLSDADPDALSPREALDLVYRLKALAKGGKKDTGS